MSEPQAPLSAHPVETEGKVATVKAHLFDPATHAPSEPGWYPVIECDGLPGCRLYDDGWWWLQEIDGRFTLGINPSFRYWVSLEVPAVLALPTEGEA